MTLCLVRPVSLAFALVGISWTSPALAQPVAESRPCVIVGRIASTGQPLPGVSVQATAGDGREAALSSTGPDGAYRLRLTEPGAYSVRANLPGFGDLVQSVAISKEVCQAAADFDLRLLSRTPKPAVADIPLPTPTPSPAASVPRTPGGNAAARGRGGPPVQPGRRFQDLNVRPDGTPGEGGAENGADIPDPMTQALLPTGFAADAPTESIAAAAGNQIETVDAFLFRDRLLALEEAGGDLEALARRLAQGGFEGGGFGAGGPGGGGFGGRGGGPGGGGPGGGGPGGPGRGNNRLQGSVNYNLSGSPFDARPYSLNGKEAEKADYFQHRYGATLGGPLKIPQIYDGSTNTSFALSYSGTHTRSPFDAYSTVPTAAQRAGDLSALGRTIIDPLTLKPFPNGVIPEDRIDASARTLLAYMPLPNQPGVSQNFRNIATTTNASNEFSLRLNHLFGAAPAARPGGRPGAGQGAPGGQRGQGGVRPQGARGPGGAVQIRRRPSMSATLTYRNSTRVDAAAFPTLGGSTKTSSIDLPITASFTTGQIFHQLRFGWNRNRSDGANLYAGSRDVAGLAGVSGVSRDPFDWGVPGLSFNTFSDLRDRNPSSRIDQRISFGDTLSRTWKKHTFRAGADLRLQKLEGQTSTNARGSFVFTGFYTAATVNGVAVPGTGLDFADFLLGRPQQTSLQFGPGRLHYSSHAINLFLQDDFRVRPNLTLNLGLRYEFVSPYREQDDHLVNLDVTPGFTAAAPVLAGQNGAYSGEFPETLIYADANNIAPRVGASWKPKPNLTVRGGFGVNYNLGAYPAIAQKLAAQAPFAVSQTNISGATSPLTLSSGFPVIQTATTNTFGIDKNYQLPAVLVFNLDIQREMKNGLTVAASYSGSRGWDLDLLRAPNRTPTGLRIANVAPFIWQSSDASSTMHLGSLRVRKRLSRGFSGGFTYTLSRSMDDASSIGGGTSVVAQDDTDLEAERGRSSFDRRHRVSGDFLVELPWGQGRKWLREGVLASVLGGWVWNGAVNFQSGAPFTARVVGDIADVARGVNGTLRANLTGQEVTLDDPQIGRWFNTAAFVIPAAGTFGNAGRNTITGPSTFMVNMGLIKNFNLGRPRVLSVRIQASNLFNTPQLTGLDTVVNSPTFGRVTRVGQMRTVQIQTRLRF